MHRHQISRGQLALHRDRSPEAKELDTLFLAQAAHLKSRPEPRSAWDDVARAEQRIPHPGHRAVECSRRAMQAALATRDDETIAATRASILAYFDGCAHAALLDCPALESLSVTNTYRAVVKESTEGISAVVEAREDRTRIHRAMKEVREMVEAGKKYLATAGRHASRSAAL